MGGSTRTHTHYWTEDGDDVRALRSVLDLLAADLEGRRPFIDRDSAQAMALRLSILEAGYVLLLDRAD